MNTLGSIALRNLAGKTSSQLEAANLVLELLRPKMPEEDLPSTRSVIHWMQGEAQPREPARRALHALGVGWGFWLVPANIAETILMGPPER